MTAPPPIYGPPRPRPHWLWWVVGVGLVVLGVVIGATVLVTSIVRATHTYALVPADSTTHQVDVPPHADVMLFSRGGVPGYCLVADRAGTLRQGGVLGDVHVETSGRQWDAFSRVGDAGDGHLQVTCRAVSGQDGAVVRVGAALDAKHLGLGIALGVLALLVLGGAGALVLVVTMVLWISRAPGRA